LSICERGHTTVKQPECCWCSAYPCYLCLQNDTLPDQPVVKLTR